MARGGSRKGAGRKPNPFKGAPPSIEPPSRVKRSYDPQVAIEAEKLCKLGATDIDLADFFGITTETIRQWRIKFADFSAATRVGKDAADDRVEMSLYHRAVGYTFDAVKIMAVAGQIVQTPYREHVPPDTAAGRLWLLNRRKDQWRDKQEIEHSGGFKIEAGGVSALLAAVKSGGDHQG